MGLPFRLVVWCESRNSTGLGRPTRFLCGGFGVVVCHAAIVFFWPFFEMATDGNTRCCLFPGVFS
jgi:hypothetical protein